VDVFDKSFIHFRQGIFAWHWLAYSGRMNGGGGGASEAVGPRAVGGDKIKRV